MKFLAWLFGGMLSFFTGVICSDTNRICTVTYPLRIRNIKKDVSFVVLTDLHGKEFGTDNKELLYKIKKENPDFIIMAGDMITAKYVLKTETVICLIRELVKDYPVYYGIGNHEARLGWDPGRYNLQYDEFMKQVKEAGAVVLDNESVVLEEYGIALTGLNMDKKYYNKKHFYPMEPEYLERTLGQKNEKYPEILLAHSPEYFDVYRKRKSELILSGHLHGGVMRLPGNYGAISPRFRLFPKLAGGICKRKGSTMIIGRGLGTHTIPVRVFNPCELIYVKMKKK